MPRSFISRDTLLTLLLFLAIILGIQLASGAFHAEFTGEADEASHFVTSLMVYDYFANWPLARPMPWAMDYYLHYPKVALGHWPPGYYVLQAIWWIIFPVARWSAILLNTAIAVATAGILYRMARQIYPGWPARFVGILLLLSPPMQRAMGQTMSDLLSVLLVVFVLHRLALLTREPSGENLAWLAAAYFAALIVKGTGVALIIAPVLALLLTGGWRQIRPSWLPMPGVFGALAVGWYYFQNFGLKHDVLQWGGIVTKMEWPVGLSLLLAGPGAVCLAAGGALVTLRTRVPVMVSASSVAISIVLVSYVLRAMTDVRHWLTLLPAILLLALALCKWLADRRRWAAWAALAGALCVFPYQFERAAPTGIAVMAGRVALPGRMLISASHGWPEGAWIAEVALRENRPSSTIIRATKVFSDIYWNRASYRLRVHSVDEIDRILDETAVDTVILHTKNQPEPLDHHAMLRQLLHNNPRWRPCGAELEVEMFCRAAPPRFPRAPLKMEMRNRIGVSIEEPR